MINYIFLFFQPGCAGNFFSRCLNLVSPNFYCWLDPLRPALIQDQQLKFNLMTYHNVEPNTNWIKFESKIVQYFSVTPLPALPPTSVAIWIGHPNYSILNKNIAGPDDNVKIFYIDPGEYIEWGILNALYKNSFIDAEWMRTGCQMLVDPNIIKISLKNIVDSPTSLLHEVQKVVNIIGHDCYSSEKIITDLWHQWQKTTLQFDQFKHFKQQLGLNL